MSIKRGDTVRLIQPVIEGVVAGAQVDDEMNVLLLVDYVDAAGQKHQRYFRPEQLEAVPAKA